MDQEVKNEEALFGAKVIAKIIGESPRDIGRLVDEEDLPAWQANGPKSTWKALRSELHIWLVCQGKRCRQKRIERRKKYVSISK